MVYNTKKYLRELKTNSYWEVEPHFYYWSLINIFDYFETAIKHKISSKDLQSAMYGEFDKKGKPILDEFIQNFNSTIRWLKEVIKKQEDGNSSQP